MRRQPPNLDSQPWKDFFKKLATAKPSEIFDFDALECHLHRKRLWIEKIISKGKKRHTRRKRLKKPLMHRQAVDQY